MTASRELKTPTMSVPLLNGVEESEATKLTRSFTKLTLNELIAGHEGVHVRETLSQSDSGLWQRAYYVTLKLHPAERIKTAFGLSLKDIAQVVAKQFVPALSTQMKLELRRSATDGEGIISVEGGTSSDIVEQEGREKSKTNNGGSDLLDDEDDNDDESVEVAVPEDGARANRSQMESYEEDDDVDAAHVASNDESDTENEDGGGTSNQATTPLHSESSFIGSDVGVKVDDGRNLIHLQPLRVDPSARPLLMVGLVEKAAARTLVRSRKNIEQAFINEEDGRGRCLQTAGINFSEIWQLERVDHSKLLSNDIWAVRCSYGVEAARSTIVDQIRSVFGVYGIDVDPRHLSLIADYMTFSGGYTAMSRTGMREMSSPFLQMSFETTAQFLTQAALISSKDNLQSPSANIVVGRPIRHGTGSFSLLAK
jgi:DNA-directed RNA polymerase I subunit RPA1